MNEVVCCRCGESFHSELWWKLPVIFGLFALAIIVTILLRAL